MAVVLAASVFVLVSGVAKPNLFCNLAGPLSPPPPGWDWAIDHSNDCAMTLVDGAGNQAPDHLYQGTSIPAPPEPSIPLGEQIAITGLAFSSVGIVVVIVRAPIHRRKQDHVMATSART